MMMPPLPQPTAPRLCMECLPGKREAATYYAIDWLGYRILNSQMCSRHASNARRRGFRTARLEDAKVPDR